MMDKLRNNLPEQIGKHKVMVFKDIANNLVRNMKDGTEAETGLPKSNVLYFDLEEDSWCCVRPSGTEPKIKLYFGVKSDSLENAEKDLEKLKNAMCEIVK